MLDVLTIAALVDEFADRLIGGRIQKTLQLDDSSIGLEVYANRRREFLIASADSRNPRLYLSSERTTADPDNVTPLLLLLRKYARGGQIVAVQQPPLERIVRLSIAKRFFTDKQGRLLDDEEDDGEDEPELVYSDLIVEIMGRRSNIILVNETGRIHDAVKRVTPEMSRVRPIQPGRQYAPPPPQEKRDPRHLVVSDLIAILSQAKPDDLVASLLVEHLAGMSPQMAREAVFRAAGDARIASSRLSDHDEAALELARAIESVLAPLESGVWQPAVYTVDGQPIAFAPIRLASMAAVSEERLVASISAAIEQASAASAQPTHVRHAQRRSRLAAEIEQGVERARARLSSLEEEEQRARAVERWRQMGEAIYAGLYEIRPGDREITLDGLTIPLDPALTPSENAQAYFDRYRKARAATEHLPALIEQTKGELDYLRQLKTLCDLSDGIDEIEQIQREWEDWGRQRRPTADAKPGKRGRKEQPPRRPRPLRTPRGDLIYVGHNGRQNDLITFEIGTPDDTWLHARGLPGAHVLIHWAGPEADDVVELAAGLAAWFSEGRGAGSVEVDVAPRRHVRKIKGAGPGMVTYRNERTLRVRPRSPEALGLA